VGSVNYPVTLMERDGVDHRVELVYHGPAVWPRVSIRIVWHDGELPDFAFTVREADVLDAFRRPHVYCAHSPVA
jgi:hypothetical protein